MSGHRCQKAGTGHAIGEVPSDVTLHVDRGQRVRDHVAQITRDP
jgi:hypothetical protein